MALVLPRAFPFHDLPPDERLLYRVDRMRLSDLRGVGEIERAAFPAPWPVSAYRYELTQNDLSTYLVVRPEDERPDVQAQSMPPLLAYGGFWLMVDEAHISTIAVHPAWRRCGLGELMLVALIEAAILVDAVEVTLEVRVSNIVAQNLYRQYGFVQVGRRKRYYRDNNEDALIMTTPQVDDPRFSHFYATLKTALPDKLARKALCRGRED